MTSPKLLKIPEMLLHSSPSAQTWMNANMLNVKNFKCDFIHVSVILFQFIYTKKIKNQSIPSIWMLLVWSGLSMSWSDLSTWRSQTVFLSSTGATCKNSFYLQRRTLDFCLQCQWAQQLHPSTCSCPTCAPKQHSKMKIKKTVRRSYKLWSYKSDVTVDICLLTFSIVPRSGLCHVSILIMKLSFMYSF